VEGAGDYSDLDANGTVIVDFTGRATKPSPIATFDGEIISES
jgi:hypothetical protein